MKKLARKSTFKDAHIDSSIVGAYLIGVIIFAVWIAYETRFVVNPIWLGTSIITIAAYQLAVWWVMRQYWEVNRIMAVFTINLVSLGLIMNLVSYVLNITLPSDLPIVSLYVNAADFPMTSILPGAVAMAYAVIALFVGFIFTVGMIIIDDLKPIIRLKKFLRLDEIDLRIDVFLEGRSGMMAEDRLEVWLVLPLILLIIVLAVVVGGAKIISL